MLAACSSADEVATAPAATPEAGETPINFGAYMNRTTTRGGYEGELTTDALKDAANGFGVLAYYTDNQPYNPNATPNFMYNQQVTCVDPNAATAVWTYSPLKYWPNEFGADATSEGLDQLSFFAYAPYTAVNLVTGYAADAENGIIGMTRSAESGNPKVRYLASFDPSKKVDLCWAEPQKNKTKDQFNVTQTVGFNFNHALASLNVQIDALFDETAAPGANALDANTRIWVRSVTFEGFAMKGELNLNIENTVPEWNDLYSNGLLTGEPVTIYDGRRDGREGYAAMPNEKPIGLNPDLVQDGEYTTNATTITGTGPNEHHGVTATTVNLFEGAADENDPIYVIPTDVPMQVTIVYDVETFDPHLSSTFLSDNKTNGVSIENTITKTILVNPANPNSGLVLDAGYKYTVKLHLGMTSVKVDADVIPWDDDAEVDIDLPANN